MHAIERLRYIARAGDVESTELACEAAYALSGLSSDRRALLFATRRLLEFHPDCGPLWWVCAHMLESANIRSTAMALIGQLESDATLDELFALAPSESIVVAHPTRTVVRALCERVDLSVRLVGDHRMLRTSIRFFSDALVPPSGFTVDELDAALTGATLAIVEALAASANGIYLDAAARTIASRSAAAGVPLYVVAGIGRRLPDGLFDAMMHHLDRSLSSADERHGPGDREDIDDRVMAGLDEQEHAQSAKPLETASAHVLPIEVAHGVVFERGVLAPGVALNRNPAVSHIRCPVPGELLGPFGIAG